MPTFYANKSLTHLTFAMPSFGQKPNLIQRPFTTFDVAIPGNMKKRQLFLGMLACAK